MIRRTYKKLIAMLVLFTLAAAPLAGCSVEPSVSFKEKNIEIYTFEEYPLEVDVKGGSADDIVWFSQSPKIAMVSGGKLIGLKTGETVVTATLGNSVTQCWVTVLKNPENRTLLVNKESLTLEAGGSDTVTATIRESGKTITNSVEWTTSDSAVATVDQSGRITAVSRGKAIITAYSYLKGQHLFKDITVNVVYLASANALLRFEDGDAAQAEGATLTEYSGDKEALGFEEGDTVYEYKARGGDDSRLFAAEVKGQDGAMNYDRLIFKIKFNSSINGQINLWLARSKRRAFNFGHHSAVLRRGGQDRQVF